jgi:hypothetical protein
LSLAAYLYLARCANRSTSELIPIKISWFTTDVSEARVLADFEGSNLKKMSGKAETKHRFKNLKQNKRS